MTLPKIDPDYMETIPVPLALVEAYKKDGCLPHQMSNEAIALLNACLVSLEDANRLDQEGSG